MKIREKFTTEAIQRITDFFSNHMKDENFSEMGCLSEVIDEIIYSDKYYYELRGLFTKSGNPEVLDFTDNDFIFRE